MIQMSAHTGPVHEIAKAKTDNGFYNLAGSRGKTVLRQNHYPCRDSLRGPHIPAMAVAYARSAAIPHPIRSARRGHR
ncbi:hypothetical protein GCM10007175_24920 [Pseudarthrobacter scleromae]|uniref:Uncharacterized protein n=1 Tax=Pseudarthrobacter scleromae TaxID=158897 RepID=A0ABQ2CFL7_9MICC|nr:hypothetical protein GCM10007175_24920 [Pseudarthrobacter scleromae]